MIRVLFGWHQKPPSKLQNANICFQLESPSPPRFNYFLSFSLQRFIFLSRSNTRWWNGIFFADEMKLPTNSLSLWLWDVSLCKEKVEQSRLVFGVNIFTLLPCWKMKTNYFCSGGWFSRSHTVVDVFFLPFCLMITKFDGLNAHQANIKQQLV